MRGETRVTKKEESKGEINKQHMRWEDNESHDDKSYDNEATINMIKVTSTF